MKREIKFRVWHNFEKCFEDILDDRYHILCINHGMPLYRLPLEISRKRYGYRQNENDYPFATLSNIFGSPDFYTVQQYTGLKDKNGKEIYEGDIVLRRGCQPFQIKIPDCFRFDYYGQLDGEFEYSTVYEIIGNICENPNLLKNEN